MGKNVIIYTDGSCLSNPGPGGYAAILRYGGVTRELWGGEPETTNNRMELLAAIKALEQLSRPCAVALFTDSQYVMKGFTEKWLLNWKKKNWKTAGNKPVKNQELWQKLDELVSFHTVEWQYVRGHQGQAENERCDQLARAAAEKIQQGAAAFFDCGEYQGK